MASHNPKETASSDDLFHRVGERALKAMADHPAATRGACFAVVLAILAVWGGLSYSRAQAQKAGFALVEAFAVKDVTPLSVSAERAAVAAAQGEDHKKRGGKDDDDGGDDDDAKDDDDDDGDDSFSDESTEATLPQFADKAARDKAAYEAFTQLARKHKASIATLAALEALAVADEDPAAVADDTGAHKADLLARAASDLASQNPLMPVAVLRQAQLAEDRGDIDGALTAYNRVIAAQIQFLGDDARVQKARLLIAKGDVQQASEALEDVQNNYPQSAMADEVRIQMSALEALRQHDGGPAGATVAGAAAG